MAAITPFYADATWTNGDMTGGTADVVIVWDVRTPTYSSNLPDPPAYPEPTSEEELKAAMRERNRELALAAQSWMSTFRHTRRPPPAPAGVAARPPRPTQRRTATATRNFRRT